MRRDDLGRDDEELARNLAAHLQSEHELGGRRGGARRAVEAEAYEATDS